MRSPLVAFGICGNDTRSFLCTTVIVASRIKTWLISDELMLFGDLCHKKMPRSTIFRSLFPASPMSKTPPITLFDYLAFLFPFSFLSSAACIIPSSVFSRPT